MKNPLNLSKHIVGFDIETSGLEKGKDRIIQLSAIKYTNTWKQVAEFNHYICPSGEWEMQKDAQDVHGISKEFILENGVPLTSVYQEWIDFIDDCDLLTYNGNAFDIPFMYADFAKDGLDPMIMGHRLIDVYKIETKVNSNTLSCAYERYTGKPAVDAHDSSADVKMTMRVFYEQLQRYDLEEIVNSDEMKMDFPEQILALNEDGRIQLTGGKYKSLLIFDVIKSDPSYIKWLFSKVLCQNSKDKVMEEYNRLK